MAAKLCNVCNTRRVYTGSKGTETAPHASDMCNYCFEEGGWENTHSDYNHDAINAEVADKGGDPASYLSKTDLEELSSMAACWICHPERNLAQQPKKVQDQKNSSVAGFTRRQQLNHKGHSHPATPAARRECKKAFWATKPAEAKLAEAMQKWDCQLDGFGKPAAPAPKKGGWAGVVPQTKNGKANLKAVQAKVDAANASK